MLKIENLNVHYGKIHALNDVSIEVPDKSVITIVGSNGAGKSTLLRSVAGLVKLSGGRITFDGKSIEQLPPHKRVKAGIVLTPEGRRVFPKMTVRENIALGAFTRSKSELQGVEETAFSMFPRLKDRYNQLAGTLSGGEQQMLAIARSMASKPKLLLLDEPSMGLAPNMVDVVESAINYIRDQGVSILIVEQNIFMAFDVSDFGYVIQTGNIVLSGKSCELANVEMVKKAYLGEIKE
ncbi:MAG: ABC transporter ATP-binding protein [Clostridia bacterium]|nr:ABC transporter ATP-binding protein [Clostridiales bacterium]